MAAIFTHKEKKVLIGIAVLVIVGLLAWYFYPRVRWGGHCASQVSYRPATKYSSEHYFYVKEFETKKDAVAYCLEVQQRYQ